MPYDPTDQDRSLREETADAIAESKITRLMSESIRRDLLKGRVELSSMRAQARVQLGRAAAMLWNRR